MTFYLKGWSYYENGDIKKSHRELEEALKLWTHIYRGSLSEKTLKNLNGIEMKIKEVEASNERLAWARLREVLEILKRLFDTDENHYRNHRDEMLEIAVNFGNLGDHQSCLKHYEKMLEVERKIFKNDEVKDIADTMNQIAYYKGQLKFHETALEEHRRVLEIRRKINKDDENVDVVQSLNNVSIELCNLGQHKNALDERFKILEIRKNIYESEKHPDVARSFDSIGIEYFHLREYNLAEEYFIKAVDVSEVVLGEKDHILTKTFKKHRDDLQNSGLLKKN